MEEKLNLNPELQANDIVIRKGDAPKIKCPVKFKIEGLITAPNAYVSKRKHLINKDKCLVVCNEKAGSIKFIQDISDEDSTEITGVLKVNPDLLKFKINTETVYNINDLIKFLRMNRIHFADVDVHGDFINKLANFKATITTQIEQKNDNRGNIKVSLEQIAKTQMPNSFNLCVELYEGFNPLTFKVEIFLAARDTAVDFWFESIELKELLETEKNRILQEQLEPLNDYVIIEI